MLYKFKSKATGDLIMLEPQGRQILKIMGKEAGAKGIIEPKEMLAAIQALREAVKAEEDAYKDEEITEEDVPKIDGTRTISLKQRAVPFINMLQRAHAEDKDIVWGV